MIVYLIIIVVGDVQTAFELNTNNGAKISVTPKGKTFLKSSLRN
jgi:hypothetical protein